MWGERCQQPVCAGTRESWAGSRASWGAVTHSVFCGTLIVPCFGPVGPLQLSLEPPHWVCCTCLVSRPLFWGRIRDALTVKRAAVGGCLAQGTQSLWRDLPLLLQGKC